MKAGMRALAVIVVAAAIGLMTTAAHAEKLTSKSACKARFGKGSGDRGACKACVKSGGKYKRKDGGWKCKGGGGYGYKKHKKNRYKKDRYKYGKKYKKNRYKKDKYKYGKSSDKKIKDKAGCKARFQPKSAIRRLCKDCVKAGGKYKRDGESWHCSTHVGKKGKKVRAEKPPKGKGDGLKLRNKMACKITFAKGSEQRKSCKTCVTGGGKYKRKNGVWKCKR